MFKFSGMQSKKLESWKCCIKTSNEYNTVNHFLSNLVRKIVM